MRTGRVAPASDRAARPGGRATRAETDCLACGACCWSEEPDYIRVFTADQDRMDERARALTELVAGQRRMRFVRGRCAALVLDQAAGGARCAIYDQRPDCCRWLQAGSTACRELRARRRLRAGPRAPAGRADL